MGTHKTRTVDYPLEKPTHGVWSGSRTPIHGIFMCISPKLCTTRVLLAHSTEWLKGKPHKYSTKSEPKSRNAVVSSHAHTYTLNGPLVLVAQVGAIVAVH